MEVIAKYDWKGSLSGYKWGDMTVPIDKGNRDYQLIKQAIANGTCVVNEPAIEEVTAIYNQQGNLSGYRWNNIFVPIDESNKLYHLIKEAIDNFSCKVNQLPSESKNLHIESIIFCVFFDRPWYNIDDFSEGKIIYPLNNSASSKSYGFRLINLSVDEDSNKFNLLLKYHGIKTEKIPIVLPLKFGLFELEVPSKYLQRLLKNEKNLLDEDRTNFVGDALSQHLKESGRSRDRGADIRWAINNAKIYLENFIMEIGNRVIEAYAREFEELPIGYINRWKVCEETFVLNKYKDGTFGIGNFGLQGKLGFNFGVEWQQRMSLLQVSQPEEYPTHPQTNALRRVRLLVREGLHMEALCLLNTFLEVNIRDVLIKCIKSDTKAQKLILNMDYKILLDILKKINKGANDNLFRTKDYLEKIKAAENILDMRNAYMHRLSMTEQTRERPFDINGYAHQLDLTGKEQVLNINQRRELERLMYRFMDVWESHLWIGIQTRLASGEDAAAISIIQQTIFKKGLFRWLKPLALVDRGF